MKLLLDISGFEKFIELTNKLEENKNLSNKDWNLLFSTPGYNALIESEYNKDFFVKSFTLVFDSTKSESLEQELETSISRYLKYYLKVKENKEEYQKNVNSIQEKWDKIEVNIITRSLSLLPNIEYLSDPTISIVIFDTDARGYETVVIDAAFAENLESFVSMVSHEVFHFFRNKHLCYNKEDVEESDKDLIWGLNQLHSEGIADQIDKDYFIYGKTKTPFPQGYINLFKKSVRDAPETIKKIDKLISQLSEDHSKRKEIIDELRRTIPLAGHPTGYYMTTLIIKNGLVEKLIKDASNPFSFFRLFNEAVQKDREEIPSFSDDCLKVIQKLEDKYKK
ncbi:MAG: hypothetical protein KAS63_10715 [Candidatus Heimdallarchaeota archaeon]|nr:hypothetical protein [Candidatus Heimdallarchaeota archaeon]MCK4955827.1 hypothetical protein [Candidatus Heimdallarchaeota archaeon]